MTITTEWGRDARGRAAITVRKSKGKLTVEEIQTEVSKIHEGWSAIIIRTGGETYIGWMDEEPKGDEVTVFPLEDGEPCPVCAEIPPLDRLYCPECGNTMKEVKQ